MSKCVIFIILVAVQVIYSKAQEGTTEILTIEEKHERTTQSPSDNAQEYITLEFSIVEKILDYSIQKLSESRSLPTPLNLGLNAIKNIFKCAMGIASNITQGYIAAYEKIVDCVTQKLNAELFVLRTTIGECTIRHKFSCAMGKRSDDVQKCKEELKKILESAALKQSNGTQDCILEISTMQNILDCATQKAKSSSQGSNVPLSSIETILECAKLIPSENPQECTIDRSTIKNILECAALKPHHECEQNFRNYHYNKEEL